MPLSKDRNLLTSLLLTLTALIFIIDLSLPMGITKPVLYVSIIVISLWDSRRRATIQLAMLCTILTAFGHLLREPASHAALSVSISNRAIAVLAIWISAFLVHFRKRIEVSQTQLTERSKRLQQAIVRIATDLNLSTAGISRACQTICKVAAENLGIERSSIWLLSPDRQQLSCINLFEKSEDRHSAGTILLAGDYPKYFAALESGVVIDASDAQQDPRTAEYTSGYLKPLGITSMLDTAIRVRGQIVGTVCQEHIGPKRVWSLEDINFVSDIADQVAQALLSYDREQSVQQIKASEKKYRDLVETSNDLIWAVDASGRWTFLNRTATRAIYGYEPEEMLGRPFTDFEPPATAQRDLEVFENIKSGRAYFQYETSHIRKDGKIVHLSFNAIVLHDEKGQVVGTTGTATNISERIKSDQDRTKLEDQLRQSQKMEALGQLAGGIAHDFNNLLGAIQGYTELIKRFPNLPEKLLSYADPIQIAAQRGRDLVMQILTFSRHSSTVRTSVSLEEIICDVLALLNVSRPSNVDFEFSRDLPRESSAIVYGDRGQLSQMILNLATNAIYAMRETGGVLKISLSTDSGFAFIKVTDNGAGIAAEFQTRVFEPFFTTKPVGAGTGLGLSVVHGIVENHGGKIELNSKEGLGTSFSISLPLSARPELSSPNLIVNPAVLNAARIIVIDDEVALAHLAKEALETFGYSVDAFTNPFEAFLKIESNLDFYDLVITDQKMSQMTGHEVASRLAKLIPSLPVILCSGYDIIGNNALHENIVARLSKPYTIAELARTVEQCLNLKRRLAAN